MTDYLRPARSKQQRALVGIVVPIFKIGPIFSDTLKSLFDQACDGVDLRFVLVIDGCPYSETIQAQMADYLYGAEFPIEVCFKENAGVSVARNFGLDRLLSCFPDIEYVLFFDADDIAPPAFVRNSIAAIKKAGAQNGSIGWAYTDQYQFGAAAQWVRYPRAIMKSRFTVNNLSQPTSLVTRELIDAGVRFDENLQAGIEDWDFWFNAADAGFNGAHAGDVYVKYRRLAGSRSSVNRANDAFTKFYLRSKHAGGYRPRSLLTHEQECAPRYAFWNSGFRQFELSAALNGTLSRKASVADLIRSMTARRRYRDADAYIDEPYFPEFIVVGDRMKEGAYGAIFHAERRLVVDSELIAAFIASKSVKSKRENASFAVIRASRMFRAVLQDMTLREREDAAPIEQAAAGSSDKRSVFERLRRIARSAFSRQPAAPPHMSGEPPATSHETAKSILDETGATVDLALQDVVCTDEPLKALAEVEEIISSVRTELSLFGDPEKLAAPAAESVVGNNRGTHWNISNEAIGIKHIYPWLPSGGKKELLGVVGSACSVAEAFSLLCAISAQNPSVSMHWFVLPGREIESRLKAPFETVVPLTDASGELREKPGRHYNGVPLWERADDWNSMIADALSSCDYILNLGCIEATRAIATIRKVGPKETYFYVPSSAESRSLLRTKYEQSEHLAAYIGAYAKIIAGGDDMALFLRALGIPKSKILLEEEARRQDFLPSFSEHAVD